MMHAQAQLRPHQLPDANKQAQPLLFLLQLLTS
jgi:hypothetical protein